MKGDTVYLCHHYDPFELTCLFYFNVLLLGIVRAFENWGILIRIEEGVSPLESFSKRYPDSRRWKVIYIYCIQIVMSCLVCVFLSCRLFRDAFAMCPRQARFHATNCFTSPLKDTWMRGLLAGPTSAVNRQCFRSLCTKESKLAANQTIGIKHGVVGGNGKPNLNCSPQDTISGSSCYFYSFLLLLYVNLAVICVLWPREWNIWWPYKS